MFLKFRYGGKPITTKPWMQIQALFTMYTIVVDPVFTYPWWWFLESLSNPCCISSISIISKQCFLWTIFRGILRGGMGLFSVAICSIAITTSSRWRWCLYVQKSAWISVTFSSSPIRACCSTNALSPSCKLCIHDILKNKHGIVMTSQIRYCILSIKFSMAHAFSH